MGINFNGVKITSAMPTGKGAIEKGSKIEVDFKKVFNFNIGQGIVTELTDYSIEANGDYDVDLLGFKGSGNWTLSFASSDNGKSYNGTFSTTGTWKIKEHIDDAIPSLTNGGSKNAEITYREGGHSAEQSFQDARLVRKAKVFLSTEVNGRTMNLSFYNADQ